MKKLTVRVCMQSHHRKSRKRLPYPQYHRVELSVHGAPSSWLLLQHAFPPDLYALYRYIFDGQWHRYPFVDAAQSALLYRFRRYGQVRGDHDGQHGDMRL